MNNLEIFTNKKYGQVRTLTENGKTLFCGVDIAKPLAYKNIPDALSRHCRYIVKRDIPHPQNPEKTLEMTFIPEGDVYRLIARSKLPEAEKFERWIFDEVLPSIRKNGGYIMGQDTMSDAELMAKAVLVAQRTIAERDKRIAALEEKAAIDAPKVLFAESVEASEDTILIGELAKILKQNGVDTGEKRLFAWLRANGYLIKRKGRDHNMPTQFAMERGLFRIKECTTADAGGSERIRKTTTVTATGQKFFVNLFLANVQIALPCAAMA